MNESNVDERITLALSTLRNELIDLRSQDVELMKQLLNINNKIQTLSKKHTSHNRYRKTTSSYPRRCFSSYMLPVTSNQTGSLSNCRRLSEPVMEDSLGSSSSLEGSVYSEDLSDFSESDEDLFAKSPNLSRPPSLPIIRDSYSTLCDEDILRTNIRLWKLSQSNLCSLTK